MEPGNTFRFISHDDLLYPANVGPSFATGTAKLRYLFWSPRNGTWLRWFRRWPRRSKAAAYSAFNRWEPMSYFQNRLLAIRAPSASALNFAQTRSGSTAACPTQVPYPQSLPAITFCLPTNFA